LLPVLLPAELGGGFLRVSEHYRQAHFLQAVGSNPAGDTTLLLSRFGIFEFLPASYMLQLFGL